jgi:hypothetical protein
VTPAGEAQGSANMAGKLSTAALRSCKPMCVYRFIVKLMSEWRASSWASFGGIPLRAKSVM